MKRLISVVLALGALIGLTLPCLGIEAYADNVIGVEIHTDNVNNSIEYIINPAEVIEAYADADNVIGVEVHIDNGNNSVEYILKPAEVDGNSLESPTYHFTTPDYSYTGSKTKYGSHYDACGDPLWRISLTAAFNYNGFASHCVSDSLGYSYAVYDDSWKITSAEVSCSGNAAIGHFTIKKYYLGIPIKTVEKTLTLTCSSIGVVL